MMPRDVHLEPSSDPAEVLAIFSEHRPIHTYGIVDVVQFWQTSRWWVRGQAVVGLVELPGVGHPVVYAVSAVHGVETLALLADLVPQLPQRFPITGPIGLSERLAATHDALHSGPHVKMHLIRKDMLSEPDPQARPLEPEDLAAVRRFSAQEGAWLEYFRDDLLGTGRQVGIFDDGELLALAGVHVIDVEQSIAAIGNVVTLPEHRGRGLARRALATLCHRLCEEVDIVGLNVQRDNAAATALYEHLGFLPLMEYEEAELVRR
ncbi:MAG TPA: GNAT family N-acetyltransferase [Euzebyales bacterium]|nr:GNAT family N-acetyltransferase [Euzebyales bacterium]